MDEKHADALKEDIKYYQDLKKVASNPDVKPLFDLMLKTVADKMIWTFTTGKEGDNVKSWEDFCKVRGEVIARLHPIQEALGAGSMEKYLKEQLDKFYSAEA
jgi:hypothetical protein